MRLTCVKAQHHYSRMRLQSGEPAAPASHHHHWVGAGAGAPPGGQGGPQVLGAVPPTLLALRTHSQWLLNRD